MNGEAEVLFEAARIRAHLPLYTDPLKGVFDYGPLPTRYYVLYAPLWPYLLSFVPTSAATIVARSVSTCAWLGALVGLARLRVPERRTAAAMAAAYGAGVFVIANFASSGRPDSIAVALAGVALGRSIKRGAVDVVAAALFALAAWFKPNVIGLGVGAVLASSLVTPVLDAGKRALGVAAGALAVSVPLVWLLHAVSGGVWLEHLERSVGQSMMLHHWWNQLWRRALFLVPVLFTAWIGVRERASPPPRIAFAAFASALVWSVVSIGKIGAASNYWMEPAMGAVGVFAASPIRDMRPRAKVALWTLGAFHAVWLAAASVGSVVDAFEALPARQALILRAKDACALGPTSVLFSDSSGAEYEGNGRIVSPGFQIEWLIFTGRFPAALRIADIERPEARCVLVESDLEHAFFSPDVRAALKRKFQLIDEGAEWHLYRAR